MKILLRIKKYLILVIIQVRQNIMMKLVVGKMKYETGDVAIEESGRLKTKMY